MTPQPPSGATTPPTGYVPVGGVVPVHHSLWPNEGDAKARRLVRLADGRTARVVYVRHGMAKVRLPSGTYLNRSRCDLALLPPDQQTPPPEAP